MDFTHTKMNVEGQTAVLVIDSPPVNALGTGLKREFGERFDELGHREDIWTVILTAAGEKTFLAGADIPSLLELDYEKGLARVQETRDLFSKIANFPKPIIAAINGTCLGAGLELSLCCDIRIAAKHAKLGLPEVNLGIMPGAGGTQRLARAINPSLARYLIYTGAVLTAEEALSYGLLTKVVPYTSLIEEAEGVARKINEKGPLAVRAAKKAISRGFELPTEAALTLENELWAELCNTEDKREGISAFLEKRRPKFKGR